MVTTTLQREQVRNFLKKKNNCWAGQRGEEGKRKKRTRREVCRYRLEREMGGNIRTKIRGIIWEAYGNGQRHDNIFFDNRKTTI